MFPKNGHTARRLLISYLRVWDVYRWPPERWLIRISKLRLLWGLETLFPDVIHAVHSQPFKKLDQDWQSQWYPLSLWDSWKFERRFIRPTWKNVPWTSGQNWRPWKGIRYLGFTSSLRNYNWEKLAAFRISDQKQKLVIVLNMSWPCLLTKNRFHRRC